VLIYQGLGFYQQQRVLTYGQQLAAQRGHSAQRIEAKPSFGNILLWKVIYEIDDGYHTDAIRASLLITAYPGEFVPKLNIQRDLPWLDKNSQQAKDIKRFRWFSKGYLALDPNNPLRVTDMRYSMVPNENKGMWSIWLDPGAAENDHIEMKQDRDTSAPRREKLLKMLKGEALVTGN
ncbi:MAG: metal-dependent hydrolase, partial [Gammaproteobacteria bacterium]|nr:metal-dependent hydrolase [Gammaproteobacteria bacterium]